MFARAVVGCLLAAVPALVAAADVPVSGNKLQLRANAADARKRNATLVVADAALAAPLPDPTLGATLVVNAGADVGQCRVEVTLDPTRWRPLGGNGAQRGYRYLAPAPGTMGIRRIVLRPGLLTVSARGAAWPCELAATAERVPVSVVLRVAGTRYCAAFDAASVSRNTRGRFAARHAAAPAACPKTDLTVADLNLLHGLFCPTNTHSCRIDDRVALLFQWIVAAGCPDVVTLQEIWDPSIMAITPHLATACPFTYETVYVQVSGIDDEMILTRYPAVTFEVQPLQRDFRNVLYARIDHPLGPVDVFTTHLAAGSDGAQNPCAGVCPQECLDAGATVIRECQAVQVASYVAAKHDVATPAIVAGDFNEHPGSFAYHQLVDRGWPDTYLAAGNPECDPGTGVGCTSGRVDNNLSQLQSTASNENERIDYIFLVPPGPGSLCTATIDTGADADGDGTATRIFADDPNPFAPSCGPSPDPICWPSDHEGAQLDVNCN